MHTYSYTALKNNSEIVTGEIMAEDNSDARRKIRELGFLPTQIIDKNNFKDKANIFNKVTSLSLREKIDFTSTLQMLTSSGIPIIESLLFIEQNSDSPKVRTITNDFRKQIIGGVTLGEALEKYRDIFGRVFIGLVKSGEDSGELDKTLARMLELLKKQDATKSKVIGAIIYPAFVILLAIVAVIVMLVFVFPTFAQMFNDLDRPLPWITKACMDAGLFMKNYWYICLFAVILTSIIGNIAYKQPKIRHQIDKFVLHVPLLNDLLRFSNFSNFIAVLQVSYEAGIPVVDCLYLANLTMDNFLLKTALSQVASKVQQGTHLSVALKHINQVPTMITFLIAAGEQSGRLGEALANCVSYIDKKLDDVIDAFTKMIEPILMVFIGGLVGLLGLALYLPLFQVYQT